MQPEYYTMSGQYSQQGYQPPQYHHQNPPPYTEKPTDQSGGGGGPVSPMMMRDNQVQPNDYLTLSIFATICCCLPIGVVALIKASEVRSKFNDGDFAGANESSKSAKKWGIWGVIAGILMWISAAVFLVLYIILIVNPDKAAESDKESTPVKDKDYSYMYS